MDSGANLTFQYLRRFYDDFKSLPAPIASKVTTARVSRQPPRTSSEPR